jgi:hypothetical protein
MEAITEFLNSTSLTNILLIIVIGALVDLKRDLKAVRGNTFFLRKD